VDLESAWIGRHLIGDSKDLVFDYLSRRNYLHASTVALANRIVAFIRIFGYKLQIVYLRKVFDLYCSANHWKTNCYVDQQPSTVIFTANGGG
jgi:hypothetical protein